MVWEPPFGYCSIAIFSRVLATETQAAPAACMIDDVPARFNGIEPRFWSANFSSDRK
jgi:hypothetical protein